MLCGTVISHPESGHFKTRQMMYTETLKKVWRPMKSYYILTKQILWIFALKTCVNLNTRHGNKINDEVQTTTAGRKISGRQAAIGDQIF
jgi:hypothetical protein